MACALNKTHLPAPIDLITCPPHNCGPLLTQLVAHDGLLLAGHKTNLFLKNSETGELLTPKLRHPSLYSYSLSPTTTRDSLLKLSTVQELDIPWDFVVSHHRTLSGFLSHDGLFTVPLSSITHNSCKVSLNNVSAPSSPRSFQKTLCVDEYTIEQWYECVN